MKIKVSKNNDHDGVSHGVNCSQECDRPHSPVGELWTVAGTGTPSLLCPPWLRWCVCQFPGSAQWRTGSRCQQSQLPLEKDVRGRQRAILYNLVHCSLVSSRACFSGCMVYMRLSIGVRNCDIPRHGLLLLLLLLLSLPASLLIAGDNKDLGPVFFTAN